MRIRTIKPEFWRSDDITQLSREDRLLFIGLWTYVDDNGVGPDDFRAIAADLFALEDDQREIRDFIREGLATLSRGLLISRYTVDGKRYIYINAWDRHQRVDRPNRPRFPRPDLVTSGNNDSPDPVATPSRHIRETPSTGTEEQRNRGTEEKEQTPPLAALAAPEPLARPPRKAAAKTATVDADGFAEFYAAYPRRVERRAAERAWTAARKRGVPADRMISAARRYAASVADAEPRYVKHPASWLNAGAYDDEPAPVPARPPSRADGWQQLKHQPPRPDAIDAEIVSRRALR